MKKTPKSNFLVSRRYSGGAYDLMNAKRNALQLSINWNQDLTTFDRDIGYGLFYHTDPKAAYDWQEVTARELLDIVNVASFADQDPRVVHHGAHYQRAFQAIERLYNVSIPFRRRREKKGRQGQVVRREYVFGSIRFLQGFALVYHDDRGREIDLDDPRIDAEVVDIRERYEGPKDVKARRRAGNTWGLVQAIAELDADGNVVRLPDGRPSIRPPDAYRFLWATDIADDLADSGQGGKGAGWIKCSVDIFRVKKALRDRNQPTAAALLNLLVSDLWADPPDRRVTEKPAKDIFFLLGFPEPGSRGRQNLGQLDGRWAKNCERVAKAVRILKDEGVLMDESDERPRQDVNPNRRKAPYYRWKRPESWVFTGTLAVAERAIEQRQAARTAPRDAEQGRPNGQDIQAARKAAGMTVRDFADRFGASIGTWSSYERGKQIVFPKTADRKAVVDFVREHLPGFQEDHSQTELFQDGQPPEEGLV